MIITILTPTYNRGYILEELYKSLELQTQKNFEWFIVDDGSTDNTKHIVEDIKRKSNIKITYVYQENGGKHRALNNGISKIESEMIFVVDSDDKLTNDAIEKINNYYEKYKDNKKICGFSFLKAFSNGEIVGDKYRQDEYISDYINCRLNENITRDKAEVYFTKCLKENPFLEVPNENFLFEDYVWIKIAEKYQTIYINEVIYICEYLEDGLTKNINVKKLSSPLGMSKRGLVMCSKKCKFIIRIKGIMMYISYGIMGGISIKQLYKECSYKKLFTIFFFAGITYYIMVLKRRGEKYDT